MPNVVCLLNGWSGEKRSGELFHVSFIQVEMPWGHEPNIIKIVNQLQIQSF
jgi:hypothetical protein